MEASAKELLARALSEYRKEAEDGAATDLMIDLLHLIAKNTKDVACYDFGDRAYRAMEGFTEERQNMEAELVDKIPKEELPLHLQDEFEFETTRKYLMERLKEEETNDQA